MTTTTVERREAARPSSEFLRAIPRDYARRHLILSLGQSNGIDRLAVAASTLPAAIHNAGVRLGTSTEAMVADPEWIASEVDRCYGRESPAIAVDGNGTESSDTTLDIARLAAEADRDLLSTQGKGPVVRLVDAILFEALSRSSSDVHVQPLADRALVRYRVDGVLHDAHELPLNTSLSVISRVKVMGRMDVAERRLAQDGRATVTVGGGVGRSIDLRISTFPTSHGERTVLRLLDNSRASHLADFASLGMPNDVERAFLERAGRSSGILLVTGPTGSGKTTTLYATLRWIATHDDHGVHRVGASRGRGQNILTIEDPIEYELSSVGLAISQSQVNDKKGVTFASGLRHILRQDPDVVMVGEVRDGDTARVAIQASLTGHLVFSTLHTTDAAGAVTRLVDLGVEPYLVAASLSAVLAQRLVRTSHAACVGRGCPGCLGSGYKGRMGVFELLLVSESIRDAITRGGTASEIRSLARGQGMRTLIDEGDRLIREGRTTPEEVRRVIQGAE